MGVGHGGDESKHPAWVKIAILEFIETRFKEIVENDQDLKDEFRAKLIQYLEDCDVELTEEEITSIVNNKVADYYVKVYDPFSTEMDFYIFFNVDWPKYLELYSKYYDEDTPDIDEPKKVLEDIIWEYNPDNPDKDSIGYKWYHKKDTPHPIYLSESLIKKAIKTQKPDTEEVYIDEVFNASRSKSTIFYTIEQMRNILECGKPDGCPEPEPLV